MFRKLLIFSIFTLLFSFSFVSADSVTQDYEYDTFDNTGFDIETGNVISDINMSRTNKVLIPYNTIGDVLYLESDDFSHVLFFDNYNNYLGYANGNGSTYEIDTYLGDAIFNVSFYYVNYPSSTRTFALMNYNYEDTINSIAYTQPSIDTGAWEGLSYRDIFEGNNLIDDDSFSDVYPLGDIVHNNIVGLNLFDTYNDDYSVVNSTVSNIADGITLEATSNGTYRNVAFRLYLEPNTEYYFKTGATTTDSVDEPAVQIYDYNFTSTLTFVGDTTVGDNFTTGDTGIIEMRFFANQSTSGLNTASWSFIQLEIGSSPTTYEAYTVTPLISYAKYSIGGLEDDDTTQYFGVDYNDELQGSTFILSGTTGLTYQRFVFAEDVTTLLGIKDGPSSTANLLSLIIDGRYYTAIAYNDIDLEAEIDLNPFTVAFNPTNMYIYVVSDEVDVGVFNSLISTSDVKFIYEYETPITSDRPLYYYNPNNSIYELTSIFDEITFPTLEEFEALRDYYNKYQAVSGDTLSYDDIFSTSLIPNGDFSLDTDSDGVADNWLDYPDTYDPIIIDNMQYWKATTTGYLSRFLYVNSVVSVTPNKTYYMAITSLKDDLRLQFYNSPTNAFLANEINLLAGVNKFDLEFNASDFLRLDIRPIATDFEVGISSILLFDKTTIFGEGVEDDISLEFMDSGYNIWLDPLAEYYPAYYQADSIFTNVVYYVYDDTPGADPDFNDSLDDQMLSIGVDSSPKQLFMAFTIMIALAVILGLRFKSIAVVAIVEILLILIFTVIGWFNFWFIIILVIIMLLLLILRILKGGQQT